MTHPRWLLIYMAIYYVFHNPSPRGLAHFKQYWPVQVLPCSKDTLVAWLIQTRQSNLLSYIFITIVKCVHDTCFLWDCEMFVKQLPLSEWQNEYRPEWVWFINQQDTCKRPTTAISIQNRDCLHTQMSYIVMSHDTGNSVWQRAVRPCHNNRVVNLTMSW